MTKKKELILSGKHMNEYIAEKILESSIGDYLRKAIKDKVEEFTHYNNPLKEIVDTQIKNIIAETIKGDKYSILIREAIEKHLDSSRINLLAKDFCDNLSLKNNRY